MRFELLAKRLAEKTNTPILEQVLLGEGDLKDLPAECMTWTGATNHKIPKPRVRMLRGSNNVGYPYVTTNRPTPIIKWQGKRIGVHRLIFQLITKPDYEFTLRNICENPLCVNPFHWQVYPTEPKEEPEGEDLMPDFEIASDWTVEEIEEMLEVLLSDPNIRSWDDILQTPMMTEDGAPEDLVVEALQRLQRHHLLP